MHSIKAKPNRAINSASYKLCPKDLYDAETMINITPTTCVVNTFLKG
jgi:hypothetical protein